MEPERPTQEGELFAEMESYVDDEISTEGLPVLEDWFIQWLEDPNGDMPLSPICE